MLTPASRFAPAKQGRDSAVRFAGGNRARRTSVLALLSAAALACSPAPSPSPAPVSSGAVSQGSTTASPSAVSDASGQPSGAPSAPDTAGSPTPGASAAPEVVSAQSLIEAALASGQIDLPTSLLYRSEALFGVPGLPSAFAGAPSENEDTGLFAEIADLLPSLSAADQAKLQPFVARPTDPASIFATGTAGGAPAALTSYLGLGDRTEAADAPPACHDWADSGAASPHFKVWTCASGNPADDQSVVTSVAATLDGIWPKMTQSEPTGMGPPLPDGWTPNPGSEFGGDSRIDVYVLTLSQSVFREGDKSAIEQIALTVPSAPFKGSASSAFMLVNRGRFGSEEFRNDLIHEFFHVLQDAHNIRGMVDAGGAIHWFAEASATWAEAYYGDSSLVHHWFGAFQQSQESLESSDGEHAQSSYIWPEFMQQELDPTAIFTTYQGLEGVGKGSFASVNAVIDRKLPFKDHFRDFAVRNINRDILAQVTQPGPEKQYQQLDGTIPTTYWPATDELQISTDGPVTWTPSPMPALTARYLHVTGSGPGGRVKIDLSHLSPADSLDGDVLVHVKDHWERRQIEDGLLTYCRQAPEDNIDQLYLVLSNHSLDPGSEISGSVTITTTPCNGWEGTMSTDVTWSYANGQRSGHASTTFSGILIQDENPAHYGDCMLSGSASPLPGVDCPLVFTAQGKIGWSLDAHCPAAEDSRSGTVQAGSGFPAPDTDWQLQALFLQRAPDGSAYQYWGEGDLPLRGFQPKCDAGGAMAMPATVFFSILPDAASRSPSGNSCLGTKWTIDPTATAITGSCHDYPAGSGYDQTWTWNLQRVGDPTAPAP